MLQTVRLSSCVSAQGEIVEVLGNGDVVVRDGATFHRGRPIGRTGSARDRPDALRTVPLQVTDGTAAVGGR